MSIRSTTFAILAQRSWQAVSGLVTIFFVTRFLTPALQGWYYSFLSIAALYTLFDLGLTVVLIQISAHLSVEVQWHERGRFSGGNASIFSALVGKSTRHYLKLALLFVLILVPAGSLFFHYNHNLHEPSFSWLAPWVALVAATAISIVFLPFLSIVEGAASVREVYVVRLLQGVAGSFCCWLALVLNGKLWAAVMVPAMSAVVSGLWLVVKKPGLLSAAFASAAPYNGWKTEVWPLQWRVGLSWLSGYLLTQIYTPVLFHYQGAVVAGQMGLSLTIANMLGLISQSWIARHIPAMAQTAARRNWVAMDRMFHKDLLLSTSMYLIGALVMLAGHHWISLTSYGMRILPFQPFVGLLLVVLINHLIGCLAAQLRSYKQEPLVWVVVAGAALTVPIAFWAATAYAAQGVVAAIVTIQLVVTLPLSLWLWRRCNKVWRDIY